VPPLCFQKEFKGNRLDDLRNDVIDGNTTRIKDVFANGNVDLLWLTNNVKHRHSQRLSGDKKCLLPDDNSAGQPHLEARWIYFLTASNNDVLTPTNHQKIRWLISTVLNDSSYGYIDFDCINCDPQTMFYADEFDNNGPNPVKYLRIVLGTPPMDKLPNTNLSLDPQDGYVGPAPTLVAADGNGGAAQGQNSNATQTPDPKPTQD